MDVAYTNIFIIIAALAGFVVSSYIRYKKMRKETLVCPLNSNCDAVINSRHSIVFGVSIEVLGMLYYSGIALAYAVATLAPALVTPAVETVVHATIIAGTAFAVYLLILQLVVMREWCLWCLVSFFSSAAIFGLAILA